MRLPKYGLNRKNEHRLSYVNLAKIVEFVKKGRIDAS